MLYDVPLSTLGPMDYTLLILGVIAAVVVIGACLQRISGMGLGLLGAPVLSLMLGPVVGVLIVNVLAAINAVFQSVALRKDIDWRQFLLLGPVMVIGAVPGAWVVHNMSTAVLQVLVGALVLIGLLVTTFIPKQAAVTGTSFAMGSGAAAGFMNTLAGIAGPALTVYAQASRWSQNSFRATLQPLFFFAAFVSVLVKEISADHMVLPDVPGSVWIIGIVCMLMGLWAGTKLSGYVSASNARKVALTLAVAGAVITLVRGLVLL